MKETFTLSGKCDECNEHAEHIRPIAYGQYRCENCYKAFVQRLLQEEQEQELVDIITGKVIGKRKDVEGRS